MEHFMADTAKPLDNRIEIVTPENIAFQYRLAGPFWRLPAYLIDVGVRLALVAVTILVFILFGFVNLWALGVLPLLISWFLLAWFYGGFFETIWNGQTPGKRAMGLRVVQTDGRPIDAMQAVLRNVLRSVDSMPFFLDVAVVGMPCYQVGLISCASNSRYQRMGDLACGTMVVIEEKERLYGVARITVPAVLNLAATLPTDFIPSPSLVRAVAMYVERRGRFSPGRRAEIARHVSRALVDRFGLPADTNDDFLLCAVYHRHFARSTEMNDLAASDTEPRAATSPFTHAGDNALTEPAVTASAPPGEG